MSAKKKIRLGSLEADPDQFAIIVNYTTEMYQVDNAGYSVAQESKPGQKTIRLPQGLSIHDIPALAQKVVDECKYIPSSKVADVERLLEMLMNREAQARSGMAPTREPPPPPNPEPLTGPPPAKQRPVTRQEPLLPEADIKFVDEYADQLYEDRMDLKVHGAKCILRVCTVAKNLEILAEHETLIGVLSRELRESCKKSNELCVAIVCTFLCYSHFSQFHSVLMENQCGDVTMRVVEYESKRYEVRKQEVDSKIRRLQELGDRASSDDRAQLVKDERKYKAQLSKQNKLMLVCHMVLLNLAEEIFIEKKMVNRKMPIYLIQLLDREQEDLLLVALQFLKKLSVFETNKEQICTPDTLTRLVQLSSHQNIRIALLALRVLYNVSFDESVRASLVETGIVKLLVDHLKNPPLRHIVLQLLYHFSMDDRCKSLMTYYQDGMVMLLQLVVHFPEARVGKDLVALIVNLATHPRCAEVMVMSGLFPQVMLRELKTKDPLLCKVIRHITSHKDVCGPMCEMLQSDSVRMSKWIYEFVRMGSSCGGDSPDLLVEVLGTLANLTLPEIPWGELCESGREGEGLIDLLTRLLVAFAEDDIVLECVMIAGNLALCPSAASHLSSSRLPAIMQDLLVQKREDEEIISQTLFTFQCFLNQDELRDVVLQSPDLAPCIMRFAGSRNPAIVDQASRTLQLLSEYAGDLLGVSSEDGAPNWVDQIKAFRFEQHNKEWCHYVNRELSGGAGMSPSGGYYDDDHGSEEEEEFAFHWAGGDAADAGDLVNRDWGQRGLSGTDFSGGGFNGGYMHSSRLSIS
jgi:hypothetical protein